MANTDTWLPTGGGKDGKDKMFVKKGQRIVISIFGSHRNPANFGEDAGKFRPERWDSLNIDTPGYLPFSMGPRVCTGRKNLHFRYFSISLKLTSLIVEQLVQNVTTYMLVRLAQNYTRIESRDNKEFAARLRFSMSSQHGVWVDMIRDPQAF